MTDREIFKMALDALEAHADIGIKAAKQIEALRARLAQPEPEPVATQYKYIDAHGKDYWTSDPWEGKKVEAVRHLYAAPQREWVGLTNEEQEELSHSFQDVINSIDWKLKKKNGGSHD